MIVSFAAGIVLHRMLWKFFDWVLDAMERMDDEDRLQMYSVREAVVVISIASGLVLSAFGLASLH